jgi:uncharacterized protein YjeT (DUF2065 family)
MTGGGLLLLGVGMTLVLEGLVLALLPGRLDAALDLLRSLTRDVRRLMGLASIAAGAGLIWLAERFLS